MRWTRIEFHGSFPDGAVLPVFKGSMLRGALGFALKRTVCAVRVKVCEPCLLRPSCVYARIFEAKPDPEQRAGQVNLPHPYVLDSSSMDRETYVIGAAFKFELLLFGSLIDLLPYFIYAVEEMGRRGLGSKRQRFLLERVEVDKQIIYSPEMPQLPDPLPDRKLTLDPLPQDGDIHHIRVHLETPLRTKFAGRLVSSIDFTLLVHTALRRVRALWWEFEQQAPPLDEKLLHSQAQQIGVLNSSLHWHEQVRYSSRQKSRQFMGGVSGSLEVEGDLAPFMPLLRAAEVVHLGKETSFGMGKLRLEVIYIECT